ncbi:winged helix-turn-helix transcriptional regulator [Limosilactobacillus caccae]|uniref:winged helix-turn-helix transcriptional regulator n=1 Tax=Limosilactobacillus caccae TaxID=1926284 RepID=UPI000970D7A8|nr:winged helix-turn-helix transcriptional regulator [Limosilactobacillus caccae]
MTTEMHSGIDYTIDVLQGKWRPRIIFWLGIRPLTGNELLQLVPGSSAEQLTRQLTELQNLRVVNPVQDQAGKYALTAAGNDLRSTMTAMAVWGRQEMDDTANELPRQVVEPDASANMEELVRYIPVLDRYL